MLTGATGGRWQLGGNSVEEKAEPEVELLVRRRAGRLGEPARQERIPAAGGRQVTDGGERGRQTRIVVHPAAGTFALLAGQLAGTRTVTRVATGGRPTLHAFEVDRAGRGPLLVLWDQRDAFHGEDELPAVITWPWPAATAAVTNVFGQTQVVEGQDGQIRLPVSVDPLFITG
jgi:hypothetical protein